MSNFTHTEYSPVEYSTGFSRKNADKGNASAMRLIRLVFNRRRPFPLCVAAVQVRVTALSGRRCPDSGCLDARIAERSLFAARCIEVVLG
jgi:hypothetical protein